MANDKNNTHVFHDSNVCSLNHFRISKINRSHLIMSISQQTFSAPTTKEENDIFYKVIIENDLSRLTPTEKVQHIANVCKSLGLNPLTKPIQLHKFQGKEVMYMAKDGTEQLRNLHTVSIAKLETEFLKNDLYVVKAYATKPNGRQDCSTSAQSLTGLKGDALCNAMKKCETQAKRRVTLSICGLGMLDETELENLPQENIVAIKPVVTQVIDIQEPEVEFSQEAYDQSIKKISDCKTLTELKTVFTVAYKHPQIRCDIKYQDNIVKVYKEKKTDLEREKFLNEFDATTGEVVEASQEAQA